MNLETEKYIEKLRNLGLTDDEIVEYMSLKAMQKEYQEEKEEEITKNNWVDSLSNVLGISGLCLLFSSNLLHIDNVLNKLFATVMGLSFVLSSLFILLVKCEKVFKCHHESPYDQQIAVFDEIKNKNQKDKVKTR